MSFKYKDWTVVLFLMMQSSLSTWGGVNQLQSWCSHREPCRGKTFFHLPWIYTGVQGQAISHPSVKGSESFLHLPNLLLQN